MLASVVIITKNQKEYLRQSLPTLLAQDLKGKYEIIVVDSGSTDGALEYVKSLPTKLVALKPEDFNYARAFNLGSKKASGEFVVRLSGDCIPLKKDFLTELLKPFHDPKVGATYGKYTTSGTVGTIHPRFWPPKRFPKLQTRYSIKLRPWTGLTFNTEKRNYAFNLAGGCCAIRRKIWLVKQFDESFPEGEDAEYAWFLHLIGYDIVYNPRAACLHDHKTITGWRPKLRKFLGIMGSNVSIVRTIALYWILNGFGRDPYRKIRAC